ncbi:MAG: aldo/keto reductase [Deinococcota bacterium]
MSDIPTRQLGNTKAVISQYGLGTAPLGSLYDKVSQEQARGCFEAAWDSGIRYYDTAPLYGHGKSERRIGQFLELQDRESYVLSSKAGRLLQKPKDKRDSYAPIWADPSPFEAYFDFSYDGIMRSYEDSLQRLGVNQIDMLIIHDLDMGYQRTDARLRAHFGMLVASGYRAFDELKRAGDILAIGAGVNEIPMMPYFLDYVPLDFFLVAGRYTLLEQNVLDEAFPQCEREGVGVIVGGAFNSGILATGAREGAKFDYADAPTEVLDKVRNIYRVAESFEVSPLAAALQFPLAHPLVASVIPGAVSAAEISQNLEYTRAAIPAAFWQALKDEGLMREDAPTPS